MIFPLESIIPYLSSFFAINNPESLSTNSRLSYNNCTFVSLFDDIIPTLLLLVTRKSPVFSKYSILSYLASIIALPFKSITAYDFP